MWYFVCFKDSQAFSKLAAADNNHKMKYLFLLFVLISSCSAPQDHANFTHDSTIVIIDDTLPGINITDSPATDRPVLPVLPDSSIKPAFTNRIPADTLLAFAKSLIGTPYKYASTNPAEGFDCSGFITYVFNHFNVSVPRSSVDFTNVGREVPLSMAKKGNLILFTGTDSAVRVVGHMGIITENTDSLRFIHSSSGKANGVVITPLTDYYKGRFVKVIDIF